MPLFRRKSTDLVDDALSQVSESDADVVDDVVEETTATKGYTPPKGRQTPKRSPSQRRRAAAEPALNRREAARRERDRNRAGRQEAAQGMRRGDERFLLPRDRGPERRLVRNLVDSRRTVGTWFFGGALIVIVGSSAAMPPVVQLASNILWITLALAVVLDSFMITRKIKKLVRERFPDTTQKMGSLYFYGIMRGITFRRMRIPQPQVKVGDPV